MAERRGIPHHLLVATPAAFVLQIPVDERRGIPHHLLDVLDPHEDFSAGYFYIKAREAAADILRVWGCRDGGVGAGSSAARALPGRPAAVTPSMNIALQRSIRPC